jgi:hypothetical protein
MSSNSLTIVVSINQPRLNQFKANPIEKVKDCPNCEKSSGVGCHSRGAYSQMVNTAHHNLTVRYLSW